MSWIETDPDLLVYYYIRELCERANSPGTIKIQMIIRVLKNPTLLPVSIAINVLRVVQFSQNDSFAWAAVSSGHQNIRWHPKHLVTFIAKKKKKGSIAEMVVILGDVADTDDVCCGCSC